MTALFIIGAVALFLVWLLLTPVVVDLKYKDGDFQARLGYLALRYSALPQPDKPRKERRPKKKKAKPDEAEDQQARSTLDTVKTMWSVLQGSRKASRILRRHLIFSRVEVYIVVGGDDAHSIAETYGKLSLIVMAALDLIGVLFVLRKPKIGVAPDFLATSSKYEFSVRISIRPWYMLRAGVSVFWKFLRTLQTGKKKKQQIKGGKQHEPTTSNQ